MKKILLPIVIGSCVGFHVQAMELEASSNDINIPFDRSPVREQKSLLRVPELHKDLIQKEDTVRPLSPLKVDSSPVTAAKDHTSFDFREFETPQEAMIRKGLEELPVKNRPQDINRAMKNIELGQKVFDLLSQGKFYNALAINIPQRDLSNSFEQRVQEVISIAFNMSDAEFWELIKYDPVLAKSIASHDIPFTLQSLKAPEFNIYFRVTYIRKHIQDPVLLEKYQQAYQKSIVQLQWHLFAKSILQDRAFTSGMITFQDPQSRVFSFIDGYAEMMSPKYKLHRAIGVHSLWADKAYTRESSHWNGQKAFGGKNFGIDIKGDDGKPMSILPGNKSHLLFGVRMNGMTFVKWEEYGTTFNIKTGDYSVLHHTLRYFEKKDLEDDPTLQRREKVPSSVVDLFKRLYPKPLTSSEKTLVETDGISGILRILDQHAPTKTAEFKHYLVHDLGYQVDTLNVRKGSEVILTLPTVQLTSKSVVSTEIGDDDL